ncbi:unnamed protein product, partial [Ixodes pacificus]
TRKKNSAAHIQISASVLRDVSNPKWQRYRKSISQVPKSMGQHMSGKTRLPQCPHEGLFFAEASAQENRAFARRAHACARKARAHVSLCFGTHSCRLRLGGKQPIGELRPWSRQTSSCFRIMTLQLSCASNHCCQLY